MKKIIFLLSLFLVSTFCHAQEWQKVYQVNFIKRVGKEWVDEKTHVQENTFIMLNNSEVIIKSNSINRYMTYGEKETSNYSTHVAHLWKCLDKDGGDCVFIMKRFNDGTIIYMVVYKTFGIEFYLN